MSFIELVGAEMSALRPQSRDGKKGKMAEAGLKAGRNDLHIHHWYQNSRIVAKECSNFIGGNPIVETGILIRPSPSEISQDNFSIFHEMGGSKKSTR